MIGRGNSLYMYFDSILEFDADEYSSSLADIVTTSMNDDTVKWGNATIDRDMSEENEFGSFVTEITTTTCAKGTVTYGAEFSSYEKNGIASGTAKVSLSVDNWTFAKRRMAIRLVMASNIESLVDAKHTNEEGTLSPGESFVRHGSSLRSREGTMTFEDTLTGGTALKISSSSDTCQGELCQSLRSEKYTAIELVFSVMQDQPSSIIWDPQVVADSPSSPTEPSDPENDAPEDDPDDGSGGGGGDSNTGLIVGIVVGLVLVIGVSATAVVVYIKKKKNKKGRKHSGGVDGEKAFGDMELTLNPVFHAKSHAHHDE
jgi:hypothetical protein